MITIEDNKITVADYLAIRDAVNWKKLSAQQAGKALSNSLLVTGAYDESGRLIGMGRLVGDGSVICYVQDLIVRPDSQLQGIGSAILGHLKEHVERLREPGTQMMFCLMCAKGREPFYEKHGFQARPTDALGPGMIQYLRDAE